MMRTRLMAIAPVLCAGIHVTAVAEMLTIQGMGKAPIMADVALTRTESFNAAKRDAVVQVVNRINGPRASEDPMVQSKLDLIARQIGDDRVLDQSTSRDAANNLVTTVKVQIDDLEIRSLLSDMGVGQKTARNFPIMIVMDEFFTTPTDNQKPLREVVEFTSDRSARLAESASSSSSYDHNAVDAQASSARASAAGSSQGHYSGYYGGGGGASHAASSASAASQSYAAASAKGADAQSYSVDAEQKDVQTFKKLVEYQPRNVGPDKQNYTLQAVLRETNRYDLSVKDADLFRSKYFRGKALTLDELNNGGGLSGFVAAARDEASDYLMVGNSIILDNGKSPTTGLYVCDGLLSLKAYSTEDGAAIAAEARSESASGNSPDQCRTNVANKMGTYAIGVAGSAILEYWKRRDTYGRDYTVVLRSLMGNLNEDAKDAFSEALEGMPGINSKVVERKSTRTELEVSVTYKGEKSMSRAIGAALKGQGVLANAGRKVDGSRVTICLEGPCP